MTTLLYALNYRDTDTRFSSDTDFSEDPDGRNANSTKGKVWKARMKFLVKQDLPVLLSNIFKVQVKVSFMFVF